MKRRRDSSDSCSSSDIPLSKLNKTTDNTSNWENIDELVSLIVYNNIQLLLALSNSSKYI